MTILAEERTVGVDEPRDIVPLTERLAGHRQKLLEIRTLLSDLVGPAGDLKSVGRDEAYRMTRAHDLMEDIEQETVLLRKQLSWLDKSI